MRRRRGISSESIRPRSFYSADPGSNTVIVDGRASEQIPRKPSDFLSPTVAAERSSLSGSAAGGSTRGAGSEQRPISPIEEEQVKYRRFSMLKFRHASDSQLSTKARLQARGDVPPLPERKHHFDLLNSPRADNHSSPRDYNNSSNRRLEWRSDEEVPYTTFRTDKNSP